MGRVGLSCTQVRGEDLTCVLSGLTVAWQAIMKELRGKGQCCEAEYCSVSTSSPTSSASSLRRASSSVSPMCSSKVCVCKMICPQRKLQDVFNNPILWRHSAAVCVEAMLSSTECARYSPRSQKPASALYMPGGKELCRASRHLLPSDTRKITTGAICKPAEQITSQIYVHFLTSFYLFHVIWKCQQPFTQYQYFTTNVPIEILQNYSK